jgi:2-amino-4-hydroxy-6-hydroxymethyldihydropteridine diphosphokinase
VGDLAVKAADFADLETFDGFQSLTARDVTATHVSGVRDGERP